MHSSDTKGETAMKKEYKDLELEIVRFDAEDVITASGDPGCPKLICTAVLTPCPHGICECDRAMCECKGPMCECVRY